MTREQAALLFENEWMGLVKASERAQAYALAIEALRGEQPCEKCVDYAALANKKAKECAEWERAYDLMGKEIWNAPEIPPVYRLFHRKHDPRRKPKPARYQDDGEWKI